MPNSKISALSDKPTPVGTDTLYIVDVADGSSKKCTLAHAMAMATPTLTTPALGAATATTINGLTITSSAAGTLTIVAGKTLTVNKSITLEGTDTTTMTFPSTSATIARIDAANTFIGASTASAWVLTAPTITTSIFATANDGAAIGDGTHAFSDLFLASGAVLNYANGDVVATHSAGVLTVGTGDLRVTTAGTNAASVVTLNGVQTLAGKTLTTPKITDTGHIDDENGLEQIVFSTTASAVNEIQIKNAAAGNNAAITGHGTGTSPGIDIAGKAGAGATNPGGTVTIAGGLGNTTGAGGLVSVTGGVGGNDAVGGAASLVGGAAGGGNRAGGQANVTAGLGKGTAAGGAIIETSGASSNGTGVSPGASGAITIQVGAAGTATTGTAGSGGLISVLGVAGGASTGLNSTAGNGSGIILTAGAGGASSGGGDTAGNGGDLIVTAGAAGAGATGGRPGAVFQRGGIWCKYQGAPTAKTVSATLTAAEVLAGIITVAQGGGAASALQLPTGTDLQNALSTSFAAGDSFDISVINTSTTDAEDASITTNTDLTLVGNMDFQAHSALAAQGSSGILRIRKTGDHVFSVYRIA